MQEQVLRTLEILHQEGMSQGLQGILLPDQATRHLQYVPTHTYIIRISFKKEVYR